MIFGEMMKSMRSTVGEPAYIHGGQAEKMFQQQLDQHIVEDLATNNGSAFVGDLYRQFRVQLGLPVETTGAVGTASGSPLNAAVVPSRSAAPSAAESAAQDRYQLSSPSASLEPVHLTRSAEAGWTAEPLEALRQARSDADATSAKTALSGLSALFRK